MNFFKHLILIIYLVFSLFAISCTSSGNKFKKFFSGDDEEEYVDEEEEDEERLALEEEESDYDESSDVDSEVSDTDFSYPEESQNYSNDGSVVQSQPKKTWVPLKKIPQTTWKHDGKWINAVYMVRENDRLDSISMMIYGHSNKQNELKSINPFLKRRDPKVGDKIYYNSPIRPNDRSQFLVYYEDMKRVPSTHDIQAGENIREVSSKLLGHPDSWKEIWATNLQVESKWVLKQTVTVQYWPASAPEAPVVEMPMEKEEMPVIEEEPSPPEEIVAEEDEIAPSFPEEDSFPMEKDMPEPMMDSKADKNVIVEEDKKTTLNLGNWKVKGGIIALILIALALWFARLIRNKKSKSDFDFSQTNIDIDSIEE